MSSGFEPDKSARYEPPAAENTSSPPDAAADNAMLLEQVLQRTLAEINTDSAVDSAEMQALAQVARRHVGQPLTVDPVVAELVQALLQLRFQQLSHSTDFWRRMSYWIANTLMEDPPSQQRLQRLWARLQELHG